MPGPETSTQAELYMIAVILAGGSGTRFWPMSRRAHPKQMLALWGDKPMITQTFDRLAKIVGAHKVFVVCGPHLKEQIAQALPELVLKNLIVEPQARNTAPAIALSAAFAHARYPDEVVGVFPSDHYIGRPAAFAACLEVAARTAQDHDIVTLGIPPTRPETGYGYIRCTHVPSSNPEPQPVRAFVEKPDAQRALDYLDGGDYLWNAGMFFFRPSAMFRLMDMHMPKSAPHARAIIDLIDTPEQDTLLPLAFEKLESISIDYGIMEQAKDVQVVPAHFPWSDVGHWAALHEVQSTDDKGNIVHANAILNDTTDSVVHSTTERLIAVSGMQGVVVVDTPDALLVIPKSQAQTVRVLIERIKEDGQEDVL